MTVAWVSAVVGVFVSTLIILWKIGLFDLAATDSGAKVVAAVLALIGVLGTAVITFIGLLFKRSFDVRNSRLQEEIENRLGMEAKHNQAMQKEAADRLRMETAIQAVGLMSTSTGVEAAKSQQIGALFALASLDQLELALALLELLLKRRKEEWDKDYLFTVIRMLHMVMTNETESRIQAGAVLALDILLQQVIKYIGHDVGIYSGSTFISYEEMRSTIEVVTFSRH